MKQKLALQKNQKISNQEHLISQPKPTKLTNKFHNLLITTYLAIIYFPSQINSQVGIDSTIQCDKFQCSQLNALQCMKRVEDTVLIHQENMCTTNEICFVDEKFDGICVSKSVDPPKLLYPGERCSSKTPETTERCAFGPEKCDSEKEVCRGFDLGAVCKQHADCNPEYFCDSGRCARLLIQGEPCNTDFACGHTSFCFQANMTQTEGVCREYMSLRPGEQAALTYANNVWSSQEAHVYCATFHVDAQGKCSTPFTSTAKGNPCTSNNNCATSDKKLTHSCRCKMSTDGSRICDAGPGDDEWVQAKTDFGHYLIGTQHCHTAQRIGECSRKDLYYKYKCSEFKAVHFTKLRDLPDCLVNLSGGNDLISAYQRYCFSNVPRSRSLIYFLNIGGYFGLFMLLSSIF